MTPTVLLSKLSYSAFKELAYQFDFGVDEHTDPFGCPGFTIKLKDQQVTVRVKRLREAQYLVWGYLQGMEYARRALE